VSVLQWWSKPLEVNAIVSGISACFCAFIVQLDSRVQLALGHPPSPPDIHNASEIMVILENLASQTQSIETAVRHGFGILSGYPICINAGLEGSAGSIHIHTTNEMQELNIRCAPLYVGCSSEIQ
jgi:hypothetical protein